MQDHPPLDKYEKLKAILGSLDSLLVAFSGGVDSSLLLYTAHEVLGEKVVGVTAESAVYPSSLRSHVDSFIQAYGIRHRYIQTDEMQEPAFLSNSQERCYYCKKGLFADLQALADELGLKHIAHGANLDDLSDFRPGFKAAEEMGIQAPLLAAGLTKEDIRFLSRLEKLPSADKPAMPCLASRIPYGTQITTEILAMIDNAEKAVAELGFEGFRVRYHQTVARLELDPYDFVKVMDDKIRLQVITAIRSAGFQYAALDLEGYSQGKLNRAIKSKPDADS